MKTEIIDEKKNPLFNRKEIILEVESEITPSHSEAEKIVSEKFKTSSEALKIKKIYGRFGSKTFRINANIYSSKEEKESIEPKSKKEKEAEAKVLEEAKKAEEEKRKAKEESKKLDEKK
ncbi:MAG: hypothetical protein Q8O84_01105 [Nanoarchaeota archaeon]|nr:hypothetical protein [Nanoarchaeota archaeon]